MCCRKGDLFQSLKLGFCLTFRMNCLRRHMCCQSKRFYWKGHLGGEQEGEATQENCSATWLAVSGFTVMGLVSGLSLAHHSDAGSFLVVHALFSQDGCQRGGFWEEVRSVVSPFDLSRTLPVGGGFSVPCSSPGPPVIKQLMPAVTLVAGQGGGFSQCASPASLHSFSQDGAISQCNSDTHSWS